MVIYSYDPQTSEYNGRMTAPKCPVTGVDVFPAWTTQTAPPTLANNQIAVYVNGAWTTVTTGLLCYYNKGLLHKTVDSTYTAAEDEVIFSTAPTEAELATAFSGYTAAVKEQKVSALDAEYQPQFADLAQAYATALMAGNTTTAAEVQTDYTALKAEYQIALEAIG